MNTLRHCLSVASLTGFATFLTAQDPASTPAASLRESVGLAPATGGFQARGFDYKAQLAADGVTYTPALGDLAPRNLPLRTSLRSVHRGGELLHTARPTQPVADGLRVTYPRGFVRETWDVTPGGMKQSFVFERPLGGDGDLVVRCDWRSELQPHVRDGSTVEFLWPELGGVRVDGVVGIDADGRRIAGSLRLDGGMLEFVLPDAFVDTASFPLVLDPLVGTSFLVYGTGNSQRSDIAVMPASGVSLVVWQQRFSTVDTDVIGQRMSSTGALLAGAFDIETGAVLAAIVSREPRVGAVSQTNQFFVAWRRGSSIFGPWDVYGAQVDASTGVVSAAIPIAATPANEADVAVGGDVSGTDNEAVVVWTTGATVEAAQVNTVAGGVPSVLGAAVLASTSGYARPAISKACGATARFLVAFEQDGPRGIACQYISRNLTLVGSSLLFASGIGDDTRPCVDGDLAEFVVAWEREELPPAGVRNIVCARLNATLSGLTVAQSPTVVAGTTGVDECNPDIALMGIKYGLVYTERTNALTDAVHAVLVNPDCTTCNTNHLLTGFGVDIRQGEPRLAARWVGPNVSDDAIVVFTNSSNSPGFSSDLNAQRWQVLGGGTAPTNLLGGCALGGTNTFTGGPFVTGNPNFKLRVTGADPAALLVLNLGLPSGGLICGSCTATNPLILEAKINVAGTAESAFVVPCDPAFVGFQMESQWISFGTAFTPCPLFTGASLSNRLLFTLGN
jgi:hypothetical protein